MLLLRLHFKKLFSYIVYGLNKNLMAFIILVLPLQLLVSSQCETINILLADDQQCTGQFQCATLEQYIANASQSSNILLQMQSGNHTLNSELSVADINNFTITGTSVRVMCSSRSAQITLSSVQHICISGISFIGCGTNMLAANGNSLELRNVAFLQNNYNYIDSTNTLVVEDSVFDDTSTTGLALGRGVNSAVIRGCTFSNNGYSGMISEADLEITESIFFRNTAPNGGCLFVGMSTVTITSSNFTECTSSGPGGAIHGTRTSFTITRTNFTDNEGNDGGALYGLQCSFNITSSNFTGNIGYIGGAIRASRLQGEATPFIMVANSEFISNTGNGGGGAIDTELITSVTCCNFIDNRATGRCGGALYAKSPSSLTISYSSFINNVGPNGGGACIELQSETGSMLYITESVFTNNTASEGCGGGINCGATGQNASVIVTSTVFSNNTATTSQESRRKTAFGGGMYATGNNISIHIHSSDFLMNAVSGNGGGLYASGSVIIVNSSDFSGNFAILGGGGAIYSDGMNVIVTLTDSTFRQNSAYFCGVVDISNDYHIVVSQGSVFTHNEATGMEIGGGVCCLRNVSVTIVNSSMSHNVARFNGGVFYIDQANIRIEDSSFINNSAYLSGGVAYTYFHPVSYDILLSTFTQNSAGRNGGVFCVARQDSNMQIKESVFSLNTAEGKGGVVSIIGSSITFNNTSTLNNNANKGEILTACSTNVSIYQNSQLVQEDEAENLICKHYNDINSSSIDEVINVTQDNILLECADCAYILLSSDSYCPLEFLGRPCFTLSTYVTYIGNEPNISLILEAGNHSLDQELIITSRYNFTMTGTNVRVMCSSTTAQITLSSVQHILISGVSFIGCGTNMLSTNGNSLKLRNVAFLQNNYNYIDSTNTLVVEDSVFDDTSTTGLALGRGVNSAVIRGCTFSNNGYSGMISEADLEITESIFFRNTAPNGGCLFVGMSTVTITSSNFTECTSSGPGGAIHGTRTSFTITRTNFTDNEGNDGGALYGLQCSFNITSSNFTGNIGYIGGAIRASRLQGEATPFIMVANSEFISNTGNGGGGAIDTELITSVTCCNFIDNRATGRCGGALYAKSPSSLTISYSSFINNVGPNGGGACIELQSETGSMLYITESVFTNNTASEGCGGGINCGATGQNASVIVTSTVFSNNTATTSQESRRKTVFGGGMCATGNNISVSIKLSEIFSNSASGSGGAVYITGSVSINNSDISNNIALTGGGAIYAIGQMFAIDSKFRHNFANEYGGVLFTQLGSIEIQDSLFYNNTALENGGAIYASFIFHSSIVYYCTFIQNTAGSFGGALFITNSSSQLSISATTFSDNTASWRGGAIYVMESTVQINETNLYNNSADSGDAISVCNGSITFPDTEFVELDGCLSYDDNINHFREVVSHRVPTASNIGSVPICPFDTPSIALTTEVDAATATSSITTVTAVTATADTTSAIDAITTTGEGTATSSTTTAVTATTDTTSAIDAITTTGEGTVTSSVTTAVTAAADTTNFTDAITTTGEGKALIPLL